MKARLLLLAFTLTLLPIVSVVGQSADTVYIGYQEFVTKAMANAGQLKYQRENVNMAENRADQAAAQRILPNLRFESQHGYVPAVRSDSVLLNGKPLPEDEYYLDPNLRNDWSDWAIYTKFNIRVAQPVFLWGGLNKSIEAARKASEAARYQYEADEVDFESRLYELYYSYVLAFEIERLLREADDKLDQVDSQIQKLVDEGDPDLDESDVFEFEIFKYEFDIQREEVYGNMEFVQETWNYILREEGNTVYLPKARFLEPVAFELEPVTFYQSAAFNNRPELKALEVGAEATEMYIDALKRQNLPGLYFGGYINFAYTPNRPYQDNPFIVNSTNYFNGGGAFVIRQNLNFFSIKANIERSKIELRRVDYARQAAQDGVLLQVNENYRKASLAEVKVDRIDKALVTAKEWLRQEQLDYDFGFGDTKDLTDALQKELELKLQLFLNIYELNTSLGQLNKSAGIPLQNLINEE